MREDKRLMKKQSAVTIISLVITIIILLIIAGISISLLTGENGILTMANEAAEKSKLAALKEELELNIVFEYENLSELTIYGNDIKKYIKSIEDEEIEDFAIVEGELTYIGDDNIVKGYCKDLGINVDILDVAVLTDHMKKVKVITDLADNDITPEEYVGVRLYDKNAENSLRWKILVEYDTNNIATNIKGSEWYYISEGTLIEGHEVEYNYIINYKSSEIKVVSNYKIWDVNSSLGVSEGLVMNVDSTNMDTDNWGNIEKYGDVKYVEDSKSLYFDGDGDYLKVTSPGDFSNGFTFEIYANLDRLNYAIEGNYASGLFTRIKSLEENDITKSMRFGYTSANLICKFNSYSNWSGIGEKLSTLSYGDIRINNVNDMYKVNEDFYLTFVYRTYKDSTEEEREHLGWTIDQDRIEYYIDGELVGYTYFDSQSYINGAAVWNNESTPMFIGVAQWWKTTSKYYLQGDVYSCRLYETSLSKEDVALNYNTTLQWRNIDI